MKIKMGFIKFQVLGFIILVLVILGGFLFSFSYAQIHQEGATVNISAVVEEVEEVTSPSAPGVGWVPPPLATKVILQGKAYPLSSVTILIDGRVVDTIIADSQARFRKEITDITPGIWTFGIWAEDKEGRRSLTFTFTTRVRAGMITTISGIFLPPTIELEKTLLQRGEILNILGQSVPESEINIFINSPEEIIRQTKAGDDGIWLYAFNTIILEEGSHSARARAACPEGLLSTYSQALTFNIGEEVPVALCPRADLNKDGFTNLIDFSIMLYWWGRHCPCADQNQDGIVNLTDFSIMLFYWTG